MPTTETTLEAQLESIIRNSEWFETLASIRALSLPDWWVAGGAIRNTVWKHIYGDDCHLGIKDIDLIFFDLKARKELEQSAKVRLESAHPQWKFDVKNQSSFGNWRPWPWQFTSAPDGIAHFLHTATAVGIKLDEQNQLVIAQPYGLHDLFSGIIKPTAYRQNNSDADKKSAQFLAGCKKLTQMSD